jgi:hypothetical protein
MLYCSGLSPDPGNENLSPVACHFAVSQDDSGYSHSVFERKRYHCLFMVVIQRVGSLRLRRKDLSSGYQ